MTPSPAPTAPDAISGLRGSDWTPPHALLGFVAINFSEVPMLYEYQVIPAPTRGQKAKGIKAPEARFAYVVQELMNQMARDGWEFLRAETLPSIERSGLTSTTSVYRNLLVFRRPATGQEVAPAPEPIETPEPEPEPDPDLEPAPDLASETTATPEPSTTPR